MFRWRSLAGERMLFEAGLRMYSPAPLPILSLHPVCSGAVSSQLPAPATMLGCRHVAQAVMDSGPLEL